MSTYISKFLSATMLVFLLLSGGKLYAQSPDDPSEFDPAVPIDGGISILVAAGAALGYRSLRRGQKNRQTVIRRK